MSYRFKRETGTASIAGTIIHTVPAANVLSVIGCRAANRDDLQPHTFHIMIDQTLISGHSTPLPIGSAIDIMVGAKIIVEPGSVIRAYADADDAVDIYLSYLEQ